MEQKIENGFDITDDILSEYSDEMVLPRFSGHLIKSG